MSKKFISDKKKEKYNDLSNLLDNIENLDKILEQDLNLINEREESTGMTILFQAVINGNYTIAEHLLEKYHSDANVQNIYGETPLHHAVENSNHKLINLLLENGGNPNIQQQDGETPMHIAAIKGDYKVIKLLNLYGGDTLIKTFNLGYTSLDYASERGNQKCIEVIMELIEKKSRNLKTADNYSNNTQFTSVNVYEEDRIGLQTTKNSDSPLHRFKNNIDMRLDTFNNFSSNNTSRNCPINDTGNLIHKYKNKILNRERNLSCNLNQNSFLNQMNNFEERLAKIKKELIDNANSENPDNKNNIINNINHNIKNYNSYTNSDQHNSSDLKSPRSNNSNKHKIDFTKFKHSKKYSYNSATLPKFLNYDSLINNHNLKKGKNTNPNYSRKKESDENKFTLNMMEDNRMITLRADEDYLEEAETENEVNVTRITHNVEDVCNFPLQKSSYKNNLNSENNLKDNFYVNLNENFEDYNKVLAVFISTKNDIDENYIKISVKENSLHNNYKDLFNFNLNELNEFIMNTNDKEESDEESFEDDDEYIETFLENNFESTNNKIFLDSLTDKTATFNQIFEKCNNTNKIIVSNETLDRMNINFEQIRKDGSGMIEMEYNSTEAIREINSFLKTLDLEKYTFMFIKNGFDDLKLVVDQMKSDMAITDQNLKEIGINFPGDRAKILIRLEEECKNFDFHLPSNVFYTIPDFDNQSGMDINTDANVQSLLNWLSNLKMENFLFNFVNNGYHSLDLLLMQMISKNPLTEKILEEEIAIDKIGYRIRILNKLKDDSKHYFKRIKCKLAMTDKREITESCRCLIF